MIQKNLMIGLKIKAAKVAVAKEALIAYFESVKGRGAIVMYSGHGAGTGSWCMTDGRISYLDVLHWWQGVDATIAPKDNSEPDADILMKIDITDYGRRISDPCRRMDVRNEFL